MCGFCSDVFDPHFEATFRTRLSLPLETLAFLLGDKKKQDFKECFVSAEVADDFLDVNR